MGLVAGIGVYDRGKYQARYGQEFNPYYRKWSNMIRRCYAPSYQKLTNAYKGCTVHEDFLNFQKFMLWAEVQIGFGNLDFELDKDLLAEGSKIYSPDCCVFIPQEINKVTNNSPRQRNHNLVGVRQYVKGGRFNSCLYVDGKPVNLGLFETEEEAFVAYKFAKESNIKRLANKFKDVIDNRVYCKLINFNVKN